MRCSPDPTNLLAISVPTMSTPSLAATGVSFVGIGARPKTIQARRGRGVLRGALITAVVVLVMVAVAPTAINADGKRSSAADLLSKICSAKTHSLQHCETLRLCARWCS